MRYVTRLTPHQIWWEVPWVVIELELAGQPKRDKMTEELDAH